MCVCVCASIVPVGLTSNPTPPLGGGIKQPSNPHQGAGGGGYEYGVHNREKTILKRALKREALKQAVKREALKQAVKREALKQAVKRAVKETYIGKK